MHNIVIKRIIEHVIKSEDYRIEVINTINAEFIQFAIDFFKEVAIAKLNSNDITRDWYKKTFLDAELKSDDIAINSGLNKKTIHNMYRSAAKNVVVEASSEHFEALYQSIVALVETNSEVDLTLTVKFKGVSVDLNVSESLIVINTLAVKRAALRGGAWSKVGKNVEKKLVLTLCRLYGVEEKYYNVQHFVRDKSKKVDREIDFYFINNDRQYKCEVKLMGQGNPESADAIIARDSDVFIADTLSEQNKQQCNELGIHWVALRDKDGYKRFEEILKDFGIPYTPYNGNLSELSNIVSDVLDEYSE